MIIYAFVMNVSVAGLFAAGLVPGLMVGFSLMGMTVYLSKKEIIQLLVKGLHSMKSLSHSKGDTSTFNPNYNFRWNTSRYFYADRSCCNSRWVCDINKCFRPKNVKI